jgi:hypothetical protein
MHRVFETALNLLKVTKDIHRALGKVNGLADRGLRWLPHLTSDEAVPAF